ncbi:hypothetical protein [Pelovirga terrestris]|uniref:Uncharacterized protein n=1 Tax=Pelovirga terrestris TaxID=2771352 RepID=A0A8J6R6R4_9BACT|nr:hypothetical protein [Pelovirga terrestris]MBD1401664.1 hypothetical protein [Pelovirga terrestris]
MTEKQTSDTTPHRILKEAKCSSLSGNSTLLYQIGCDDEKNLYIRIKGNIDGGGFFNKEYVPLQSLLETISDKQVPFTSSVFKKLFIGKSNNTQCFVLAALLAEGLITQVENKYLAGEKRRYGVLECPASRD